MGKKTNKCSIFPVFFFFFCVAYRLSTFQQINWIIILEYKVAFAGKQMKMNLKKIFHPTLFTYITYFNLFATLKKRVKPIKYITLRHLRCTTYDWEIPNINMNRYQMCHSANTVKFKVKTYQGLWTSCHLCMLSVIKWLRKPDLIT